MKIINNCEQFVTLGWLEVKLSKKNTAAGLFVKGTFKLESGGVATQFPDGPDSVTGDLHLEEEDHKSIIYPSDFVPYKPRADLLLNASAYTPGATPAKAITVGYGFGHYLKKLSIFGDRQWVRGIAGRFHSEPRLFTEMPLCYENALGGVDDRNNPVGKGRRTAELPNIEFLDQRVTSPDSPLPPAGFGPLHHEWAQRKSLVGTYGGNYTEQVWPAFPGDFDPGYFNSAPRDQQLDGYLRGDEPLVFYNLHPEHAEYKTALPGLRARCFLEQETGNDSEGPLRELKLNLDTLWVDMHSEKLVLVWRGLVTPVESPKLKEFRSVFVMTEPLDEPEHDIAYYRNRMQEVIAAEEAEFEIEERPMPDIGAEVDAAMVELDAEVVKAELEFQHLEAEAEVSEKKHLAMVREQLGEDAYKLDEVLAAPPMSEIPPEKIAAQIETVRAEDPDKAAEFESLVAEAQTAEAEMAAMDAKAEAFEAEFTEEPPITRESVIAAVQAGQMLNEVDLSDLDLSGLDLRGLQAIDCRCNETDFSHTDLANAILTESSLRKAILTGANMTGANLDEVSFSDAKCTGTIFRDISLNGADFSELDLTGADFSRATGELADFSGAILVAARFTRAKLPLSDFDSCNVEGADFSAADLSNADFAAVQAKNTNFEEANITGFRSGKSADFSDSNFRRVKADGSMWEECVFNHADFTQAQLNGAQFVDADLTQCMFDRVSAADANFEGADMQGGWFGNANFLRCSFERAKLGEARIAASNLYESGFLDAETDDKTEFTGSFLRGTLLEIRKLAAGEGEGGQDG